MRIPWLSPRPAPTTVMASGLSRIEPTPAEMTRAANAASIHAVPRTHLVTRWVDGAPITREEPLLPDGDARRLLLAEAAAGRDVYAYQATPHHANRWNIWYGPLANADPLRHDGRVPALVWAAKWDTILVAMASGGDVHAIIHGAPVTQPFTQANGFGGAGGRKGGVA